MSKKSENVAVNPSHYRRGNKFQLINLIRHMPFSMGNAIKYCYRNGEKNDTITQELEKALWYINDYHMAPEVIDFDVNELGDLSTKVFAGLPEWEKTICFMITNYYILNLVKADDFNESTTMDELYDSIVEMITNRIDELS